MNVSNEINVGEYMKQLNRHAAVREYLFLTINNLSINTPNDLIYQSSLLANLSQSINQLTRLSAVNDHSLLDSIEYRYEL